MNTRRYYWKAIDLNDLDDQVIDHLVTLAAARPTASTLIPIWHFGGAMSRVDPSATAFWRRHVPYMVSFDTTWDDPADDQRCIEWARHCDDLDLHRNQSSGTMSRHRGQRWPFGG